VLARERSRTETTFPDLADYMGKKTTTAIAQFTISHRLAPSDDQRSDHRAHFGEGHPRFACPGRKTDASKQHLVIYMLMRLPISGETVTRLARWLNHGEIGSVHLRGSARLARWARCIVPSVIAKATARPMRCSERRARDRGGAVSRLHRSDATRESFRPREQRGRSLENGCGTGAHQRPAHHVPFADGGNPRFASSGGGRRTPTGNIA
jgi:hypothetical protein